MAIIEIDERSIDSSSVSPYITNFVVFGLFDILIEQVVVFPTPSQGGKPSLLILTGRNGCGKTTILRMIAGALTLNFDIYRKVPFGRAVLSLSDGSSVSVSRTNNENFPLTVCFTDHKRQQYEVILAKERETAEYTTHQRQSIDEMRKVALIVLNTIDFELLDIHRSLPLRGEQQDADERNVYYAQLANSKRLSLSPPRAAMRSDSLSQKVQRFIREAQVNYKKYFEADDLELLPRLLRSVQHPANTSSGESLLKRIHAMRETHEDLMRFGLETNEDDLSSLENIIEEQQHNDAHSLSILSTYIETQESRNRSQQLIANRLKEFESIMDEFLIGKRVRVDRRTGLRITAFKQRIREYDLSSGEFHFLYMMVSALLCQRYGSIIAVDEPELSLHVAWQRRIVKALSRCAAGASPLFIFATHSSAISAEHRDRICKLRED